MTFAEAKKERTERSSVKKEPPCDFTDLKTKIEDRLARPHKNFAALKAYLDEKGLFYDVLDESNCLLNLGVRCQNKVMHLLMNCDDDAISIEAVPEGLTPERPQFLGLYQLLNEVNQSVRYGAFHLCAKEDTCQIVFRTTFCMPNPFDRDLLGLYLGACLHVPEACYNDLQDACIGFLGEETIPYLDNLKYALLDLEEN